MRGTIISVNVSPIRTVTHDGKTVRTAIGKKPVSGRVPVDASGCRGDAQANLKFHGGPDRAVYAYASEDYDWWSERLGRPLPPGLFGENLTLSGIDVSGARIGERWRIGSAIVAVTSPRLPCASLARVMNDPHFVKTFGAALRPGAYLRVVDDGEIGSGDEATVLSRPDHDLTLATMMHINLFDHARIPEALAVPDLPGYVREWAMEHQQ
jgi:MOSC domain-containing protein YiiM